MENGNPQLVARDLKRSFRMGPRRIEVLRGISMEVSVAKWFFCAARREQARRRCYIPCGIGAAGIGHGGIRRAAALHRQFAVAGANSKQKMGFVFQGYFLLPELTALENVMLPGMIGGER